MGENLLMTHILVVATGSAHTGHGRIDSVGRGLCHHPRPVRRAVVMRRDGLHVHGWVVDNMRH